MATVVKFSCMQFRHSQVVKNSFCLRFSIFVLIAPAKLFKILVFKTAHHAEQNKENKFSKRSSMYLAPVVQKVDSAIR